MISFVQNSRRDKIIVKKSSSVVPGSRGKELTAEAPNGTFSVS